MIARHAALLFAISAPAPTMAQIASLPLPIQAQVEGNSPNITPAPAVPAPVQFRTTETVEIVRNDTGQRVPASASDFIKFAMVLMNDNKPTEAIPLFSQAIAMDPFSSFAFANRGLARAQIEDWAGAEEDTDRALVLDGATSVAFSVKGLIAAHRGAFDEAVSAFSRAIELYPDDRYARLQRARVHLLVRDYAAGTADAEWVAASRPESWRAVEILADILMAQDRSGDAIARVDRAIGESRHLNTPKAQRDLLCGNLLYLKGRLLWQSHRVPEAIEAYGEVIRLTGWLNAYLARAELRVPTDRDGALADIARAQAINPMSRDVFRIQAFVLTRSGDPAAAITKLDAALLKLPDDVMLLGARAYAHDKLGQHDAALDDLEAARRAHPDDLATAEALCRRKAGYRKRLDTALADCNAALAADPYAPSRLTARGLLYLQLGRPADAARDYALAAKLASEPAEAIYGHGVALIRSGQAEAGRVELDRAKTIDPTIGEDFEEDGVTP